jgi:hypothetical protein
MAGAAADRWQARLEAMADAHVFREAGGYAEVDDATTQRTVRLRGLTHAMTTSVYVPIKPAATAAPPRRQPRATKKARGKTQYLTAKGARVLGCRGAMRGTLVHAHVYHLFNSANEAAFLALYPDGPHPWALRVLGDMLARGWEPIACEVAVHNAALKLWTKLDLVAVDTRSGRLLVIELKTGYERGAWDLVADGQWRPEAQLRRLACTPKHRAMVQATLGALLAVRLLGIADVAAELETWVVQVNDETGVTWTHVPLAFVHEDGHHLYGVLARAAAIPPPIHG